MQVSQNTSNVNNAVIGAQAIKSFRIAETPEFFHILSSSLYSNPKFAVVREILCNAWDAHKAAGVEKPVEITLTDDKLEIKDFGSGIAPEDMEDIYCVYGSSTKQNQEDQTGGFGLGCKAPFAFVDTFEVTSCYQGTKTIYSLTKTSIDTDGKPAISTLVQLPTEETGLTVSLNLPKTYGYGNYHDFRGYIEELYRWSGNPISINGSVYTGNFIEMPAGWAIVKPLNYINRADFYISYGDIYYPCNFDHPFKNEFSALFPYEKIVFKAEPNSLDITPSRESLQYSAKTKNTLNRLLDKYYRYFKFAKQNALSVTIQRFIVSDSTEYVKYLLNPPIINAFNQLCTVYALKKYKWEYIQSLALITALKKENKFYPSAYKAFKQPKALPALKWMYKHVLKGIDLKNLFYGYSSNKITTWHKYAQESQQLKRPISAAPLRKEVFLIYSFEKLTFIGASSLDKIFYKVRSKRQAEKIKKDFENKGWTVKEDYLSFPQKNTATKKDPDKIPKSINITRLKDCFYFNNTNFSSGLFSINRLSLVSSLEFESEYVVKVQENRGSFLYYLKTYAPFTLVVSTEKAYQYCLKRGKKSIEELISNIENSLSQDSDFIKYISNSFDNFKYFFSIKAPEKDVDSFCKKDRILKFIQNHNLYHHFKHPYLKGLKELNEMDLIAYKIYREYCWVTGYKNKFIGYPKSKNFKKFINLLLKSNLCYYDLPYISDSKEVHELADFLNDHILVRRKN